MVNANTIPAWLSASLDERGAQSITEAVQKAEKRTSGEIVPMLVQSSTINASAPFLAVFILGFCVLVVKHGFWLYDFGTVVPEAIWSALFALSVMLGFIFGRSAVGQRCLTPRWEKARQTQQRALLEFYQAGLNKTKGQTGILLFISWRERQAVVLADEEISRHCKPEVFNEVVKELVQGAKTNRLAEGYARAIGICADILEKHIPLQPDDVNELKDHLRIID